MKTPRPSLRRLAGFLALFALSGPGATLAQTPPLEVTTSFSILGDLVRQVGGDKVRVRALVGANEDAHAFQPRPSDARDIGTSALVVVNGLGFDDWMTRLARSGNYKGRIVVASEGVSTIEMADDDHDHHGHDHDHGHGADPHAWQDLANAQHYVANIAAALAAADPAHAEDYRTNAAHYNGRLKALDAEIRAAFAALPAERRKVVTSHDAFAYFGKAYGIRFLAPVGVSNNAEPTAKGVARLIEQLKAEKIPAVFIENVADPRLIERIRSESGTRIGGTLYSDALSAPSGPAPDYLSMMRSNFKVLHDALAAQ
ncbi:metal ABC transporter solute-binding protein, Zn/Mn family [Thauera linaloolentis]|uniref:Putative manganese transport system periplasmic-binding protein n=1 Tax=Thauera linaloolentis (strain DSM 12138 / JCM 21573 / CCUG 41526 / CIP 105981 / IAM 15112 / NBRC 102519 / 47Lol) TaxID=1123367 RepID=N6Z8P1_THAL4|nr:zinc ABC transporter substrate-binding protein [Thauera linaloolentis]ENO90728.1 putative manganese transport system periplasmic-binding protein [Thauera linaloolentis 47Lol = DSM 12138]MCM8565637.1 zinc ABC transporter substrate-binding protein [Thauera linaloolentis]